MRRSLVFAALGISLVACATDESKAGKGAGRDWRCASTAVHNGETVTCTAAAEKTSGFTASDPGGSGDGAIYLRSYGVPAEESGSPPSGEGTTAPPPPPPPPVEYDCSLGGEHCPSAAELPPTPTGGGTTSGIVSAAATDYRCTDANATTTCTRKTIECTEGTMQAGGECLAPGEAPTTSSGVGCTFTQGYWKNHASQWPTQVLTIGGVLYTQAELLAIFNTPPTGDASLILGHQLIAAMLNAANGAGLAQVGSAISAAQAWMSANKDGDGRLPYGTASTSPAGVEAVAISAKLDTYNNGGLDVPHCN
jgi:hypothetical protein